MSGPLTFFGGLIVLIYVVVAILWFRNRLLGRLAVREGIRRPGQTLLVIGGLMVGAAGITASLVGADSARDSSIYNAFRSWGATDLTVEAGGKFFPTKVANELAIDPSIAGRIDGVQAGLESIGAISNHDTKQSDSGVRLIGFDPETQAAFGPYVLADGGKTFGGDLGKKGVLVSRQLAEDLEIEVGDELVMRVEGEKTHPSPKQLGNRLKALGKRLARLQRVGEKKAKAAATKAGEAAARAAAEQVVLQAAAQARAAGLAAQKKGAKYAKLVAKAQAAAAAGKPVPRLPPPPGPPRLPDPAQVQADAKAAAEAAGLAAAQQAAAETGAKFAKKAKPLAREFKHTQNRLKRTAKSLRPVHLEVAGIAKSEGPGAYGLVAAVFAPLDLAQRIASTDDINIVRLSGNGDIETGLAPAMASLPAVRAVVAELPQPDKPLTVKPVKRDAVDGAQDSTEFTYALLVAMSMLVLAAGVALVINLVQMLAEERRSRLGILRAMGLTRRGLVTLSVIEGAIYALLAAAVGTFVGVFAGRILAERFAKAFAGFFGGAVDFRFVFEPHVETLAVSFAAGALITLITLFFTARKTSYLNIPAAIRNLPEPARERRRGPVVRALRVALGCLVFLVSIPVMIRGGSVPALRLAAGVIFVMILARLAKRIGVPERLRSSVYGLLLAGWAFFMVQAVAGEDDPNKFFLVFTLSVIAAVVGLSTAAAANLRVVERLAGLFGFVFHRLRAVLRPPLAYLARRKMRTGLSIVMFAVVMAIISMFSVFLFIFKPAYERDSLGYDVVVTSPGKDGVTLPPAVRPQIAGKAIIETRVYTGSLESEFQDQEKIFAPLYVFGPEQLADPPMRLSARAEQFGSAQEVWQKVAGDPTWVISDFGQVGDPFTLQGENGPVTFHVAGNPAPGLFTGVIGSEETFKPFDDTTNGEAMLLSAKPGVDPVKLADLIENKKYKDGVTSQTTRSLMSTGYRATRTFFSVIDVLMRMGLVVGILSLGILALRAVVERRHVIGVLRAIGYHRRGVMAGLLVEAGATATLGVAVGAMAGIAMGWLFFTSSFPESQFGIEWPSLRDALVLVYVAVLLVTIGPAWRASRLPPAEAVRYTE